MKKSIQIDISGRVQGVGFRWATREVARKFSIRGFVKNLDNGNVYIEAEGSEQNIGFFIKWCRTGPPHAEVKEVRYIEQDTANFDFFEIKH